MLSRGGWPQKKIMLSCTMIPVSDEQRYPYASSCQGAQPLRQQAAVCITSTSIAYGKWLHCTHRVPHLCFKEDVS